MHSALRFFHYYPFHKDQHYYLATDSLQLHVLPNMQGAEESSAVCLLHQLELLCEAETHTSRRYLLQLQYGVVTSCYFPRLRQGSHQV